MTYFRKLVPTPLVSVGLLALWIALAREVSVGQILTGLALGLVVPRLMSKLNPERAHLRRPLVAARYLDQSSLDLAAQLADRELTPAAAATWNELQRRFQAALDTLDEQDQEVVLMRHFEHLSNSEVAQALNVSEAAAGMRYLRAMRRLRTKLDGTGGNREN